MRELERAPTEIQLPTALAVIGQGRVAGAIARAAAGAGIAVSKHGRDDVVEASAGAEAVLICVPDSAIEDAAAQVALADPAPLRVGHTSGATELGALAPLAALGVRTFSLHPLQTVPAPQASLAGAPCAIAAADPATATWAAELASALGMEPFAVPEERRADYHAAASIASNFLIALEESAAALMADATGLDGRRLLAPLVERTVANWVRQGPLALTGPIARGDEDTVERHRAALAETAPELLPLYEALAERTRALAAAPAGVGA